MLSADEVFPGLSIPAGTGRIVAAYSGGLDSHVLLHLLHHYASARSLKPLAVHINHGLNPRAGIWADHCREVCAQLDIEFSQVELDARAPKGESQEAWARKLRYGALLRYIGPDDVLITAHHRDDMAETLLLQLLRGAGPAGLAAMPPLARFGEGWHGRPLLQYPRTDLMAYAMQYGLDWIEDDSNTDPRYDRNYLRHTIVPALKQRWPALSATLYRAARLQADAASLLEALAVADLSVCAFNNGRELRVSSLLTMSHARAANVLRYWIRERGYPVPNEKQTDEIFSGVLAAGVDATPCVSWTGTELRRYRDCLFITAALPGLPDPLHRLSWNLDTDCQLALGELHAQREAGKGIRCEGINNQLDICFRRGDDRIKVREQHRELRKLFQQHGVAPCYRDYVPLLYAGDTLVAIPGMAIADGWQAKANEDGWTIDWTAWGAVRPGSDSGEVL